MKHLLLLVLLLFLIKVSFGQIDSISIAKGDLITSNLKPGLHQYLVYFENPAKKRITNSSIWNRKVNFTTLHGRQVIEIEQSWYSGDSLFNRYVYSISDGKSFAPIYHKTKTHIGVEGFDFDGKSITGSDSLKNNLKENFNLGLQEPTLNWELDMEIFSTLPIKKEGQRFFINFYHPGSKSNPKYYEYAIIGSEKLKVVNDGTIDCWQMKINYSADAWAIFWIAKKSKEVLKMQEYFRGGFRYKVKFLTPIEMRYN